MANPHNGTSASVRPTRWRVGIDIGGTFTDLLLTDDENPGGAWFGKVLTTPDDPARGVAAALTEALERAGAATR
ncbi:MAG: hypothetical protein EBS89_08380, partial [Proteobacteria bacterium]|nr:hypothetical protein [Pseudomonadota bacterium]